MEEENCKIHTKTCCNNFLIEFILFSIFFFWILVFLKIFHFFYHFLRKCDFKYKLAKLKICFKKFLNIFWLLFFFCKIYEKTYDLYTLFYRNDLFYVTSLIFFISKLFNALLNFLHVKNILKNIYIPLTSTKIEKKMKTSKSLEQQNNRIESNFKSNEDDDFESILLNEDEKIETFLFQEKPFSRGKIQIL
jgi:hypothetical protein